MKIAELLEAAMEWTVTIEGRDEFGEVQRAQLQIEKGFDRLTAGEIGLSIDDGKRIMTKLQDLVVKQELATALSHCKIGHVTNPLGHRTQAAATTSRHVCRADALKARCVLAEVRWRWTLKVL